VSRDADLLGEMARFDCAAVCLSVTTVDPSLARIMEPRASVPALRLEAVEKLTQAGVPVGIMVAPVIPGINDHEIPAILEAAARAGARCAGYVMLRLPYQVKAIFETWLDTHFPDRKEKVLNKIRDLRGGNLYDSRWRLRQKGEGIFAEQTEALFRVSAHKFGIDGDFPELSTEHFRRPAGPQRNLF